MIRTPDTQNWVLLGTAAASQTVWGLRRIDFPCGYNVPAGAFVAPGQALEKPISGSQAWILGGFALEISAGGKELTAEEAPRRVAGYRPWICIYQAALLDELGERTHTIEMWDRGVAIFYGLWREATHALGDLVPTDQFPAVASLPTRLTVGGAAVEGEAASVYAHDAASILPFMSDFMTLSPGDLFIQGPLVAMPLPDDAVETVFEAGDLRYRAAFA